MSKKQKKKKHKKKKNNKSLILGMVIFLIVVSLMTGYVAFCVKLEDDVIWEKTSINGIDVCGLTKEEALSKLNEDYQQKFENATISVSLDEDTYVIPIDNILEFDASQKIDEIYETGHNAWIMRPIEWLQVQNQDPSSDTIMPVLSNSDLLKEDILKSGIQEHNSVVNSTYEIQESVILVHKGKQGKQADLEQLESNIRTALEENILSEGVECPFISGDPEGIDFQALYNEIFSEVKEASVDRENNYEIIPSSDGVSFDVALANSMYEEADYGIDFTVPLTVVKPEISTEDMQTNLFSTTIGSYTTYGGGTSGRINNINQAVKSVNGTVLLPGEVFSYNDVLGKRTEERGFKMAGAYENGAVVQELGGGICQVSSTIFAAVLKTNLEIVNRSSHSMPVHYMPLGMDATVSWGGPEFRFKNNRKYPIKLDVSYSGGAIAVKIIGANETTDKIEVELVTVGELRVETYRKIYDEAGNLKERVKVATSSYRQPTTPTPAPTQKPAGPQTPAAPTQAPPAPTAPPAPSVTDTPVTETPPVNG